MTRPIHILARTAALVLCLATAPLAAQSRPIAPGDHLRFSPEPQGVWTVQSTTADSLVVRNANGATRTLPNGVMLIRRAEGKDRLGSLVRGALIGLASGSAVGAAFGYAQGDDPEENFIRFTAEENALLGAVLFGGLGTIVGTVVGIAAPRSSWKVVPSSSATASISLEAPDGRPGVLMTVSF